MNISVKRVLAGLVLAGVTGLLSSCYVAPGYSYVRGTGYAGDAYYGTAPSVVYGDPYGYGYYGGPYGYYGGWGYYGYGCCYGGWYGRGRYWGHGDHDWHGGRGGWHGGGHGGWHGGGHGSGGHGGHGH
ncbi:MAG TPA: hypothetical protein VMA74_13540 [Dyella sp.]|uniref:hypothetical protein n=1 Tax=Dyella sp. TaxID=1869338 RepID=UPI002CB4CD98|nr:hypothetical protein [Dyella sp.]HUB90741.1 hypothetical protein [Dyella sp.]